MKRVRSILAGHVLFLTSISNNPNGEDSMITQRLSNAIYIGGDPDDDKTISIGGDPDDDKTINIGGDPDEDKT